MGLLIILSIGLLAGTFSGIMGTGSTVILLPALAFAYGPKEAVPIMVVAAVMANVSRVFAWWNAVDWRAVAAYSATGVPAAALGARTMLVLPPRAIDAAIGTFLLLMIPARRWLAENLVQLRFPHLAAAGMGIGFLSGIVASTGPVSVPVFIGFGLTKGAFIGTEAAASLAIAAARTLMFQGAGALPIGDIFKGLFVGVSLMVGSFIAKPFVFRLGPETFRLLMDALLLVSGLSLLWRAVAELS